MNLAKREHHQQEVNDVAQLLDRVIRTAHGFDAGGAKAAWLAQVLQVTPACLSNYRSGERPLPAYMVPLIDAALDGHQLASGMAEFGGLGVYEMTITPSTESLETLQELIQRTHGVADAELTKALRDRTLSGEECGIIHPLASKMRRFWQDVEERTQRRAA